jgi:hypothetical protein
VSNTSRGITFRGNISDIRDIEDCIRASKRYTEGRLRQQDHPVQGGKFASRKFCKYYEVYPSLEVGWDMPAGAAIDLLWGDVEYVDVVFNYDYRCNEASVTIRGDSTLTGLLLSSIRGLCDVVRADMVSNGDLHDVTVLLRKAKVIARQRMAQEIEQKGNGKPSGVFDKFVNFLTPGGRTK